MTVERKIRGGAQSFLPVEVRLKPPDVWSRVFVVCLLCSAGAMLVVGCDAPDGTLREQLYAAAIQEYFLPPDLDRRTMEAMGERWDYPVRRLAIRPIVRMVYPEQSQIDTAAIDYLSRELGAPRGLLAEFVSVTQKRPVDTLRLGTVHGRHWLMPTEISERLPREWDALDPMVRAEVGGPWDVIHFPIPPVVSADHREALVYTVFEEHMALMGRVAYLKHEEGVWRVHQSVELWSIN